MATLTLIAFVAWQPGAKAVHDAPQPTPAPCPAPTPGDHTLTVDTPEGQRQVLLHAPAGANKPRPLVIALHGAGETGSDFANDTGFSRLADREGFLVAYPSAGGPNSFWNISGQAPGASDVEALERSLDQLEAAGCVDRGPGLRHRRVERRRHDGAAGLRSLRAPRRRGIGRRRLPLAAACKPERPLPVLEIHGTADQVVPYGGKPPDFNGAVKRWLWQWRRIDGCQGNADRLRPASGVTEIAWRHCTAGTRVEHVRLDGQAHGWPGGARTDPPPAPFAATWRTWQFFRSLPPRPPVQTG